MAENKKKKNVFQEKPKRKRRKRRRRRPVGHDWKTKEAKATSSKTTTATQS